MSSRLPTDSSNLLLSCWVGWIRYNLTIVRSIQGAELDNVPAFEGGMEEKLDEETPGLNSTPAQVCPL